MYVSIYHVLVKEKGYLAFGRSSKARDQKE